MHPGETYKLLEDIFSTIRKKNQYGTRGEVVTVLSVEHYPVIIVETKKKLRFPVRVEKLYK